MAGVKYCRHCDSTGHSTDECVNPLPASVYEQPVQAEKIQHPAHYGGADNPYEAIKVIEAWNLGFALGNAVKYISRAGKKPGESELDDLKKARFYLERRLQQLEKEKPK
jgi:hypothetical protein